MRILVIGSGGREHAIIWKLAQSPKVEKIFCIPGNGGIQEFAQCITGDSSDVENLVSFAKDNHIDLTMVGPELPLTLGIVDAFQREGLKIFGPTREGARLEGSKSYSKAFMKKYSIPTARYVDCTQQEQALAAIEDFSFPVVIKADGLAAGKGVIIAQDFQEAQECISEMMVEGIFGEAGKKVIIEEFLEGKEISLLVFLNSNGFVPMVTAQDYKRELNHDEGLNTGGMGAISPSPIDTEEIQQRVWTEIVQPTFEAIKKEDIEYRGVLYFGLMITKEGPKLLEYNVRFGDPETQAILPRLDSDLLDVMMDVIEDKPLESSLCWKAEKAVTVVLTSGGYPGPYVKGKPITETAPNEETMIFHGGTLAKQGKYYTDGGRVLTLTALGDSLEEAAQKVYSEIKNIHFEGMHFRTDIGLEGKSASGFDKR